MRTQTRTVPGAGLRPGPRHAIAPRTRRCAAGMLLALLLSAGCGMDADFERAARSDTTTAWDDYLRAHPDGPHAKEARTRLAALLDDREWQRAHAADTADAYQRYLRGYPQGAHVHDALVAIASLNLAHAPTNVASAEPSPPPPAASVATAPPRADAPATAPQPPDPRVATREGFRVQLGALADRAAADKAWRDLATRHPDLSVRTPLIESARAADGRAIYRLQVGGFDRAGAEALCRALATQNDPCFTIPPLPATVEPPR